MELQYGHKVTRVKISQRCIAVTVYDSMKPGRRKDTCSSRVSYARKVI